MEQNHIDTYRAPDTQPPYKVLLERGDFTDPSRNERTVPYKIYYPENLPGKVPVILWSHGFGGNRDGAAFLSRYLAGFGYVLVHMTHPGTDSSLWEGKPGHPWDVLRKTDVPRSATLDRFYDVPFTLDRLHELAADKPDFGEIMDLDNAGMSGHSFGAMTAQVMAGMAFPDEKGKLIRIREPRFKAAIAYSPNPVTHLTDADPAELYGSMDIPLFFQTGTQDDSPLAGFDYRRRLQVYEHAGHPEKYLLVKDGGDHMVYNGTRGKLQANPLREKHEEIIKVSSLAFWDAYLKGDENAYDWLKGGGLTEVVDGLADFRA